MVLSIQKGFPMKKIKIVNLDNIPFKTIGVILDELSKTQTTIYYGKVDSFSYIVNDVSYYIEIKYGKRDTVFTIKKSIG